MRRTRGGGGRGWSALLRTVDSREAAMRPSDGGDRSLVVGVGVGVGVGESGWAGPASLAVPGAGGPVTVSEMSEMRRQTTGY